MQTSSNYSLNHVLKIRWTKVTVPLILNFISKEGTETFSQVFTSALQFIQILYLGKFFWLLLAIPFRLDHPMVWDTLWNMDKNSSRQVLVLRNPSWAAREPEFRELPLSRGCIFCAVPVLLIEALSSAQFWSKTWGDPKDSNHHKSEKGTAVPLVPKALCWRN